MSALLNRSAPIAANELDRRLTSGDDGRHRRNRPAEWLRNHSATLWWLSPIVLVSALVNAVNLAGSPAHGYAESTIAMRAWSIGHLGQLTPYTYTYDQPPFGWLQIAGWTGLTGGFSRYDLAVDAAREAMVAATVVSVILLWFVARRLGLGRAASGVATFLFALSPLAINLHRTVYLDNIATGWILAALLLATSRRWQLLGFAGSAATLAVAILSSETSLLAVPLVAIVMWRSAYPENRRFTLSIAGAVLVLILGAFVMFAFITGQLFDSTKHPSLIGGIMSQFGSDAIRGSLLPEIDSALSQWRRLDPVLFFMAPVAAVVGLFVRRIRAMAIALLALIAIAIVSLAADSRDSLQGPLVILALPVSALVIASVVDHVIRLRRTRTLAARSRAVSLIAVLALSAVALVPTWTPPLSSLVHADSSRTETARAEKWIVANVRKDSRLIVDNSMWVGLVTAGFATDNVVAFSQLDTDATVKAQSPQGWKDSDFVVSTHHMRTTVDAKSADSAITNSLVVASFGSGAQRIQIRRIVPAGAAQATANQTGELAQRAALGNEIADNPMVTASAASLASLRSGAVDPRISLLIGQLAPDGAVEISRFAVVAGETGRPIREVVLSSVNGRTLSADGKLTAAGRAIAESLKGSFAAQSARPVSDGLVIEFSIDLPAGIIQ